MSQKLGPSQEDLCAKKLLQESCRDISGCYEVGLLWKHEHDETARMMPTSESEVMAHQRTLKSAQHLKANSVLKKKVEDKVQELLDKGQAEVIEDPSVCQDIVWHMPPVIDEQEGKDKLRYCHDA